MGTRDTVEQLEAAIAECVRLERELAAAQAVIAKARDVRLRKPGSAGVLQVAADLVAILDQSPTGALAAAIRQAKAEALREAGRKFANYSTNLAEETMPSGSRYVTTERWLLNEADRIEREGADRAE